MPNNQLYAAFLICNFSAKFCKFKNSCNVFDRDATYTFQLFPKIINEQCLSIFSERRYRRNRFNTELKFRNKSYCVIHSIYYLSSDTI